MTRERVGRERERSTTLLVFAFTILCITTMPIVFSKLSAFPCMGQNQFPARTEDSKGGNEWISFDPSIIEPEPGQDDTKTPDKDKEARKKKSKKRKLSYPEMFTWEVKKQSDLYLHIVRKVSFLHHMCQSIVSSVPNEQMKLFRGKAYML